MDVTTFSALSEPNRLRIVEILLDGPIGGTTSFDWSRSKRWTLGLKPTAVSGMND